MADGIRAFCAVGVTAGFHGRARTGRGGGVFYLEGRRVRYAWSGVTRGAFTGRLAARWAVAAPLMDMTWF
jgi:hypothetical protein